jgi:proline dehydrogenase
MGRILDAVQQRDGRQGDVLSLFGSHNSETVQTIKDALIRRKLATIDGDRLIVKKDVAKRISFGQLYGMNDGLTSDIVAQVTSEDGTPIVLKVSYGTAARIKGFMISYDTIDRFCHTAPFNSACHGSLDVQWTTKLY